MADVPGMQSPMRLRWGPMGTLRCDEPQGTDIHITVTKPLSVASNGVLKKVTDHKNKWHTWHWSTDYNINPYNINFTIGNFDVVERIIPSLGKPLKTQFYVLNENIAGSEKLLDQAEVFIDFFTRNFGQYPWVKEKLGIVNTPYWGMEHQTIIAYGNEYKNNTRRRCAQGTMPPKYAIFPATQGGIGNTTALKISSVNVTSCVQSLPNKHWGAGVP